MKRKVVSLIFFLATSLTANSLYMGMDLALAGNTNKYTGGSSLTGTELTNDYSAMKLRVGYGEEADLKLQAYFSYIAYDEGIYDDTNEALYEFGAELIKEFAYDEDFFPFVKGGLGFGFMGINGYTKDMATELGGNLGLGLRYKWDEDISVSTGVDMVFRQWDSVYSSTTGAQTNLQSDSTQFYVGLEYTF